MHFRQKAFVIFASNITPMQSNSIPRVSVLIPAYNEEKYILRTLDALMKQDYPDFEIIITDNASTDRTSFVIQQYINALPVTDIVVKLLYESRQGTNFARECARQAATGSVIAQLDADCIPTAKWIRKGVMHLMAHPKRVAVTGPYDYFDGETGMRSFSLFSQKAVYPFINSMVQVFGKAAILIGGNAFIKAETLEQAGGYNTALTFYGDDVDLGKRLSAYGFVAYISSLIQQSSSRRYKANGFWEVNKKYQDYFWNLVWQKESALQTAETDHPR